ncbi:hypothetical protein QJR26_17305 [Clostridium baratii]
MLRKRFYNKIIIVPVMLGLICTIISPAFMLMGSNNIELENSNSEVSRAESNIGADLTNNTSATITIDTNSGNILEVK